jgi:peptidoglycan/LPS O-acetylase OafA/YrhL
MIYKEMTQSYIYLITAMILSALIALISWRVVEKPALKLKKITLRRA